MFETLTALTLGVLIAALIFAVVISQQIGRAHV